MPRIIKGKVIIGNGGDEYRTRGYLTAYDAETGEQLWRWYSVPGDPSKPYEQPELAEAAKTWKGDNYWKIGGGGTMWDGMAYDAALDTLYVGTGNGDPWNQAIRSPGGDNLYLSSIVALDPNTGKYKWHYQTTPGETWDYTATQPLMLADLAYPEGKRRVVMQAPKNGFFYVLDAKDGKLLSAGRFPRHLGHPCRHGDGPPRRGPRGPVRHHRPARSGVAGALGMHNWHPMAFSPETGLVYIPVQIAVAPYAGPESLHAQPRRHEHRHRLQRRTGAVRGPRREMRQHRNLHPRLGPGEGEGSLAHQERGLWLVRHLATSGNLIFSGNHKGEFNAYSATTGEKLWTAPTQARVVAAPSTFMVDGQQGNA